ncbi:MAG: hypothetical protein JXR36_04185 [Bacteroidales bacterium]|nr:hypothetical protein [Bacteroidales bacterium]
MTTEEINSIINAINLMQFDLLRKYAYSDDEKHLEMYDEYVEIKKKLTPIMSIPYRSHPCKKLFKTEI